MNSAPDFYSVSPVSSATLLFLRATYSAGIVVVVAVDCHLAELLGQFLMW